MKRTELIRKATAAAGGRWEFVREGANHSVFRANGRNIVIPRHREINERTAAAILATVADAAKQNEDD